MNFKRQSSVNAGKAMSEAPAEPRTGICVLYNQHEAESGTGTGSRHSRLHPRPPAHPPPGKFGITPARTPGGAGPWLN